MTHHRSDTEDLTARTTAMVTRTIRFEERRSLTGSAGRDEEVSPEVAASQKAHVQSGEIVSLHARSARTARPRPASSVPLGRVAGRRC